MKGILGRKVGMTQVFTKDGKLIPVTVVEVEPNVVMQVKTTEKNGYNAIQLGVFEKKEKNATRAEIGNAKKANTTPKRFLKEIRDYEGSYNVGDAVSVDVFASGEVVDVTGTTKGKGFQGVIKRHNQSRGPMGHGSHYHRRPGSLGTMLPKRVLKGKNLPGHMGVETVTIQNLEVIEVNPAENYMLISGNVPGVRNSLVLIKTAVKGEKPRKAEELMEYEDAETVVDEVVEEVATEEVTVEEAPAEETVEETTEEENTNEDAKEEEDK
ncbi:MAG: 50S ribosomal protein L3 [Bacilli bacterium]|nr:50S ribosomal protein L3 [Bacilli bacterium]